MFSSQGHYSININCKDSLEFCRKNIDSGSKNRSRGQTSLDRRIPKSDKGRRRNEEMIGKEGNGLAEQAINTEAQGSL